MKLPVDFSAVKSALDSTQQSADEPLAVSLYIDENSPEDMIAHVRKAFFSTDAKIRFSMEYLSATSAPNSGDDMACIVAGTSEEVGALAERIRQAGVPVMVATSMPSLVRDLSAATGHPIPVGDLVAPRPKAPDAKGQVPAVVADDDRQEPIALDEQAIRTLDERMGQWVITACSQKKLAFALAFPFVRRPLATEAVTATSLQNAGIGAFMFIPGADMPILTLNQVKMVLQIGAAYGQPMTMDRLKEIAFVVAGAFGCRALARQGAGLVPGLGWAVKGAIGFAGTEAMGRAVIEYFEGGGNISGLANLVKRAGGAAASGAQKAAASSAGKTVVEKGSQALGRILKL